MTKLAQMVELKCTVNGFKSSFQKSGDDHDITTAHVMIRANSVVKRKSNLLQP